MKCMSCGGTTLLKVGPVRKKVGGKTTMKKGGSTKDKNWIQGAVNPKHKGYCTPMSKPTCTPRRKALAKRFKAMGKARKKNG